MIDQQLQVCEIKKKVPGTSILTISKTVFNNSNITKTSVILQQCHTFSLQALANIFKDIFSMGLLFTFHYRYIYKSELRKCTEVQCRVTSK